MFKTKRGKYKWLEIRVYNRSPLVFEYLFRNNSSELKFFVETCSEKHKECPVEVLSYDDPNDLIRETRLYKGLDTGDILSQIISENW